MYRTIQDIYEIKKPLLALHSEKGLTRNEEKNTESLTQNYAKMFTWTTQQQMPEPRQIPMSEPFTWKEICEASLKSTSIKAQIIMDFKLYPLNMHQDKYIIIYRTYKTKKQRQEPILKNLYMDR